ncbi:MAG: hypothetical protein ACREDR_21545, partial [Blastocatellia bacterium]
MIYNGNRHLLISEDSPERLSAVAAWLDSFPLQAEVTMIGPTRESSDEAGRSATRSTGARFGLERFTINRLASRAALPILAASGETPASSLTLIALVARATHFLREQGALSYFEPVASTPGFPVAAARTIEEIRMNRVVLDQLRAVKPAGLDLALLVEQVEREMSSVGIADRARVFTTALEALSAGRYESNTRPLLLIDIPVNTVLETEFISAIGLNASKVFAVAPAGDWRSIANLERALACKSQYIVRESEKDPNSLSRLKTHLFQNLSPEHRPLDETVRVTSAPGEARECVEIARQVQSEAARGIRFDRMAVFVRSNEQYRSHLQEAFYRASIAAHFAKGTTRPDPAGRALLALLACKVEKL